MAQIDYSEFLQDDAQSKSSSKGPKKRKNTPRFTNPLGKNRIGKLLIDIFTNKSILKKIGFTLFIIVLYRALASIPLAGIDMSVYREYFGTTSASEANYLLLIFTGGQLESPSIVGLGIIAYIQAAIMMQLLTPVIPKLEELKKEGQRGTQVINQITRYLTVVLGFTYSIAYIMLISRRDLSDPNATGFSAGGEGGDFLIAAAAGSDWPSITKIIFIATVLTAGTMLLLWLSEAITENGLGNGSSIIITIGIIALLPSLLQQDFSQIDFAFVANQLLEGSFNVLTDPIVVSLASVIVGAILVVVSIVYVNESVRNIDIQYARRVRGSDGGESNVLPIKLTLTGVLPIIFASAVIALPQLLIPFLNTIVEPDSAVAGVLEDVENSFLLAGTDTVVDINDFYNSLMFFLLIVIFGVFYAFIQMKPEDTAENLQKSGAFIPGIRPGRSTEKYVSNVLLRVTFAGSIFLGVIALIPQIARLLILEFEGVNLVVLSGIGGTSILIAVSVILEMVRQFNALRASRSYEKYVRN